MQFSENLQRVLAKIKEKGLEIRAEGVYSVATGRKAKSGEVERVSDMLSTIDTDLATVQGMMKAEVVTSTTRQIALQKAVPILDARLENPDINEEDISLFSCIRVPYAEGEETTDLAREAGKLVYLEGKKATRVNAEDLRVSLPDSVIADIDSRSQAYIARANEALLSISEECTKNGNVDAIHQRITGWILQNVPTALLGKLSVRSVYQGKTLIPQELMGFVDPFKCLEGKSRISTNKKLCIKNLKSLSNDPNEIAVTHIDLNALPDADTPAWEEMSLKYTKDEWDVLQAYIYATFDMNNFSRQALVLYDNGHTGKSTLFNVIAWALGGRENCGYPDPLLTSKDDKFYASVYYGKHAVFIPDCKNPNLLRTEWLHKYTGNDVISVQFKNRNAFSARCYGKAYIATNTLPSLDVMSEHIKTRLIILRPTLTSEAIERMGRRDSNGLFIKDADGKVLLKGDPNFEENLKSEFWAFLKKCKASYDRLVEDDKDPDGTIKKANIKLPESVQENCGIAQDFQTSIVLEMCDELFEFGDDKKIFAKDFRKAVDEYLKTHDIRGIDVEKVVRTLAENKSVVPVRSMRKPGTNKVSTGYSGIGLKSVDSIVDDMLSDSTLLDLSKVDLTEI